jgi:carbamate kinase
MTSEKGRIVIALGGNALQDDSGEATAKAQLAVVKRTCSQIARIVEMGYKIILVHGNGPQVGRILLASETAKDITPVMPFDVVGAMSQGYIGYHIQQSLRGELKKKGMLTPVTTLLTQVIVDEKDPGFKDPTKPIGIFYSEDEAKRLVKENGYIMKEDSGRGWRRVVASPIPQRIVEMDSIKELFGSSIIIAAGGGGIPVTESKNGELNGVAAVIDKDYAAGLLAEGISADQFIILTAVDKVAINFKKPGQRELDILSVKDAERYIKEGHFAKGSMLPKVQAAIKFVSSNPGKTATIASLDEAVGALEGKSGTRIVN